MTELPRSTEQASIDVCPECEESLIGDPIPVDVRTYYSGERFRREIPFEVPGLYAGVLYWVCPFCGYGWPRFTVGQVGELSMSAVRRHNDRREL